MAARQDVWFGRSCDLIDQLMATLHNAQFHPPLAAGSEHDHSPETTALHINALVADIDGCGSNIGDIIVKMVSMEPESGALLQLQDCLRCFSQIGHNVARDSRLAEKALQADGC